jgi:hypothetical protein
VDLTGDQTTNGTADLQATLSPGAQLRLDTDERPVTMTADDAGLTVASAGRSTTVPLTAPDRELTVRVVVDRGVIEAWTGDGRWIARRIRHLQVHRAALRGGGRLEAWRLDPVQG